MSRASAERFRWRSTEPHQAAERSTWIVSQTRAWTGTSSNYDLRTPILIGLTGWNESLYGVKGGDQVSWYAVMASKGAEFVPGDGATLQRYTVGGRLVP
jgi:hypothetical protein